MAEGFAVPRVCGQSGKVVSSCGPVNQDTITSWIAMGNVPYGLFCGIAVEVLAVGFRVGTG